MSAQVECSSKIDNQLRHKFGEIKKKEKCSKILQGRENSAMKKLCRWGLRGVDQWFYVMCRQSATHVKTLLKENIIYIVL